MNDTINVNPDFYNSTKVTVQEPQDYEQPHSQVNTDATAAVVAASLRGTILSPWFIGFSMFVLLVILAILYYYYVLRKPNDTEAQSTPPIQSTSSPPQQQSPQVQQVASSNNLVEILPGVFVVSEQKDYYTKLFSQPIYQSVQQTVPQTVITPKVEVVETSTQENTKPVVEESVDFEALSQELEQKIEDMDNSKSE